MVAPSPLTPALCRAARAYLGWTQARLADAAGRETPTVRNYERQDLPGRDSERRADRGTVLLIEMAFGAEGITFTRAAGTEGFTARR